MNDTYGTTTGIQLCFNYIIGFSFNTVIYVIKIIMNLNGHKSNQIIAKNIIIISMYKCRLNYKERNEIETKKIMMRKINQQTFASK